MRCSRQLLPCRDENRRPPAANRRPGGCRSRRYSPSDVDFDARAARPLGAHRRAARCETFSDTQERCTVRSSERASGARGVASSYGECIASTRAYRIAYSGCACSDQHWSSLFSLAASTLQPCARRRSGELHCIIAWGWCSARMGHTSVPYFATVRVLSCP